MTNSFYSALSSVLLIDCYSLMNNITFLRDKKFWKIFDCVYFTLVKHNFIRFFLCFLFLLTNYVRQFDILMTYVKTKYVISNEETFCHLLISFFLRDITK